MELKIWMNGQLLDKSKAKVSVYDHGLLYGDGIFEGIRAYAGKVFELDAHIDRLFESASVIRLNIPMERSAIADAVKQTVQANNIKDGYIRLVITRGVGPLGINPFNCPEPTIFIIADYLQMYPEERYEKGLKVASSSVIKNNPLNLPPQVKSLNYLSNILAKIEALDKGVGEAIMFNAEGYVAEAAADNIFIVKNRVVYTPPVEAGGLAGITRAAIIKLARQEGIEVVEKNLTRFELYISDEFFLTGTGAEVIGIVEMDARSIGDGTPGEITELLRKKFFEYARS